MSVTQSSNHAFTVVMPLGKLFQGLDSLSSLLSISSTALHHVELHTEQH